MSPRGQHPRGVLHGRVRDADLESSKRISLAGSHVLDPSPARVAEACEDRTPVRWVGPKLDESELDEPVHLELHVLTAHPFEPRHARNRHRAAGKQVLQDSLHGRAHTVVRLLRGAPLTHGLSEQTDLLQKLQFK